MKSLGLALTIFSLTGALAALDMSGAHRVATASSPATQPGPTPRMKHVAVASNANLNLVDADDEATGVIIDAFLVLPRATPQVASKIAAELRYD